MPTISVQDSTGATVNVQAPPAYSVAGTAATDVITVQGIAGAVPQPVSGSITVANASLAVTGAFYQATQPVSGTVSVSGTVPVSGTFWQATQPVSIATMPSTPVTGTFWQTTQPVSIAATVAISAASLPLPTGAATSAKQPTLGTAGTASTDVITVQGIASGVAQPVSGTFWQTTQPVSIATMPTTPVTGTFWQATQPVSLTSTTITGSVSVTGTFWQATQPVSLATNTPTIAAGSAIIGKVGIDQTTPGTTNLVSIGTNGTVAINAALPTGANTIGAVNIAASQTIAVTQATAASLAATVTPVTPTPFALNSAATTNATSVKASAGTLFTATVSNSGAAAAFLKLYNLATAPTVGTSVPVLTVPVPLSGIVSLNLGHSGHRFATGIALAITNLVADTDTTAVAANQVKVILDYI